VLLFRVYATLRHSNTLKAYWKATSVAHSYRSSPSNPGRADGSPSPAETCDAAELANVGNWPQVDEGDPGCDACFARGMITGRSEASTELCSDEPTHAGGEIATAGRCGGGRGKEVDAEEDEDVLDGPTAAAARPDATVATG